MQKYSYTLNKYTSYEKIFYILYVEYWYITYIKFYFDKVFGANSYCIMSHNII